MGDQDTAFVARAQQVMALHAGGRLEDAVAGYQKLLADFGPRAGVLANLGAALKDLGRYDAAVAACRDALALAPDMAVAQANLGAALVSAGRYADGETACRRAVELAPGSPETHANLGDALLHGGQPQAAVAAYRQALALKPQAPGILANLGLALRRCGQVDEALAALTLALRQDPRQVAALANLAALTWEVGRPAESGALYKAALEVRPGDVRLHRGAALSAVYREDVDSAAIADIHRRFGEACRRPARPVAIADPDPKRRLRIGFLSGDLHRHPLAANLLPGLRHHDKRAVSLHFYAHGAKNDEVTQAFRALADGWCDISRLDDEAAAARIREDGIDILVSLAGHLDDNRPVICAWRAAPVQISLYDVTTSGLDEMDYIVADRIMVPRTGEEWFIERPLCLPTFYVADPPLDFPAIRKDRPAGPPVFGCFNNPAKIGPGTLALWGRLLAARPDARLLLKYHDFYATDEIRTRFTAHLTASGAGADQISFVSSRDGRDTLLARYDGVDVALDTSPFSGSTVTFQALAMGVPVVTLAHTRMMGRWSGAMLTALGLEDWIAATPDSYIAKAVELAGLSGDGAWREALRARLVASSLCDGPKWARRMERLYRAVWRRAVKKVAGV